jgi:DNA-directed RNA polymerase subunit K
MIWPEDVLTRFEVARLVGARALQIALGAPLLVEGEKNALPNELAKLEFKKKIVPITVKRKMPDGTVSVIKAKPAIGKWLKEHSGEV